MYLYMYIPDLIDNHNIFHFGWVSAPTRLCACDQVMPLGLRPARPPPRFALAYIVCRSWFKQNTHIHLSVHVFYV